MPVAKKKVVKAAERKPITMTVVVRRSTREEQRHQEKALDVLLAELVRQHLGR